MSIGTTCLAPKSDRTRAKQQDSLIWKVRENSKNASDSNIANHAQQSEKQPNPLSAKPDRLLNLQQIRARLAGKSKSWIYNQIAQGKFPKQRKLGTTAVWSEREINAYISTILQSEGGSHV